MTDRIEKSIVLKASQDRVWRALTDSEQFGTWFRVKINGPFIPGEAARGMNLYPGYEHVRFEAHIETMDPQSYFAFRWNPYACDPNRDYAAETRTLVEFRLQEIPEGVRLTVVESGFDRLPPERRAEAFRMHEGGWETQLRNIETYLKDHER
ncbi:vanillate O-demethylase oxidoreductase VanB [Alsobacter soli]|uniref:Vanillate O-demethylase oxidoreductase VanB n=1 Tax=Alsobacter soli TaxID=2109933 RepID=A0A2T1HX47_9HYPH|nr:SRPBCC family protein [Alsobacter soli]PSC06170.1 vanillate O-demethylase oxidoreductase VanB [Alsobacter soli]